MYFHKQTGKIDMKKVKVAMFDTGYSTNVIAGKYGDDADDWVRTTEFVEVDFQPLNHSDVVKKKLTALKNQKTLLLVRHEAELNAVDNKISDLLAIPDLGSQD